MGRAEAEQRPGILADLQFGQDKDIAPDRPECVQGARAAQQLIADAANVDHGALGGGFGELSGEARDHRVNG